MPAKISLVFSFQNAVGALHKAIACFAMRDIDLSKIESRPGQVNVSELGALALSQSPQRGSQGSSNHSQQHAFQYMFYMDVLGHLQDKNMVCAMNHLRELAPFVRVFGCYPRGGLLVHDFQQTRRPTPDGTVSMGVVAGLRIGIIGFGNFGQFLARTFTRSGVHKVFASSRTDYSAVAQRLGVTFATSFEAMLEAADGKIDVLILAPSILSFEKVSFA